VPDRSFVIVAVIAFLAPVLREMLPRALVPAIVFELVGGMIVGPHILGIANTTESVELFAQTSPGNAASLRALLNAGFRPIGGEALFY